ncbi:MAG: VOC family protein [Micrococcales bacterium]|nr:VOC family protein [Micrococcales bacterium]
MLSDHTPTPTLPTADPERSRAFYEGVLGFTPGEDAVGGLFYPSGDSSFFVYPSAYAGTNKATALSFELPADAFDEVVASLRAAGVSFDTFEAEELTWNDGVAEMDDMRSVWFSDPDGNILNVETRTG